MANNTDLTGKWYVTVKAPMKCRRPGSRGRAVTFLPGDKLWIQNRDYRGTGHIMIGRTSQKYGEGYLFTREQYNEYFKDHVDFVKNEMTVVCEVAREVARKLKISVNEVLASEKTMDVIFEKVRNARDMPQEVKQQQRGR